MRGAASRYGLGQAVGGRLLELGALHDKERAYLVNSFQATYVGVEVVPHEATREPGVYDWIYSRHGMSRVPNVDVVLATIKCILTTSGVCGVVTPDSPDGRKFTAEEWMAKYRQHGLIPVYASLQSHVGSTEVHLVMVHREALEAKLLEPDFPAAEKAAIRTLLAQGETR